MAQITIYIDEETEKKMSAAAEANQMSKSKWVSELIREKVAGEWPASVVALAGSWEDFPELNNIRSNQGPDVVRESL